MFLLGLAVRFLLLGLFSPHPAHSVCLEDERAIINKPCKHYNNREDMYKHYRAKLENALDSARNTHPVKKAWTEGNIDVVDPPAVLNEMEARVLVAYGRATLKGYKMNDTDPLGDQLVDPIFYFLSKAYEKLLRYGKNTSETLYFVKSDKGGYMSCWPRFPTKLTQPEIAHKDRLRAVMIAGVKGTIYQIKPLAAVNYGTYLTGRTGKPFSPRYLIMPCSKYMVTDREIKQGRKFVYLKEMNHNEASSLTSKLTFIPFILMLVISHKD